MVTENRTDDSWLYSFLFVAVGVAGVLVTALYLVFRSG
jgi:hypothetical protein